VIRRSDDHDRYLWEREGEADPFVQRLEQTLRHRRRHVEDAGMRGLLARRRPGRAFAGAAAAAAVVAASLILWLAGGLNPASDGGSGGVGVVGDDRWATRTTTDVQRDTDLTDGSNPVASELAHGGPANGGADEVEGNAMGDEASATTDSTSVSADIGHAEFQSASDTALPASNR